MARGLKIGFGTVLLTLSIFYTIAVLIIIQESREDAWYEAKHYLEYEFKDFEKVNGEVEFEGETFSAFTGFDLYHFTFTVRNLSTVACEAHPGSYLNWKTDSYYGAYPEDGPVYVDYHKLFYEGEIQMVPGRSESELEVYVQVEHGAREVIAYYRPNWEEEDVEIRIPLEQTLYEK